MVAKRRKLRPLTGSTLPSFDAKGIDLDLDNKSMLAVILKCKRRECCKWFIVRKADLRHREFQTMPCPHCMRVSRIPDAKTLAKL